MTAKEKKKNKATNKQTLAISALRPSILDFKSAIIIKLNVIN